MQTLKLVTSGDLIPPFVISFYYRRPGVPERVKIRACVTLLPSGEYYLVEHFTLDGSATEIAIPPQRVAIEDDCWIDADARRETPLSKLLGEAIEVEMTK